MPTLSITALIGGALVVLAGPPAAQMNLPPSADLYWWYHPAGNTCPIFPFDPDDDDSRTEAREACREAINSYYCVPSYGTAMPAC
jgi:hypothetical protein